ncbi:MAG: hypothetical protein BGO82_17205 [Devosia sp. 67-54]|uniref:hypothetical protein n=1 Tax=unclassified Devosia TaxID=196773 RepID=UPI00096463BD|nr:MULTISPECIES: hypothetical protein [unclassified Devosia]MBN9304112.1 hypothetical protein [Devosia sp.]OJX17947.1 MAG: hypothetical protein BGO82_17205 [Devosia sp. 67-54]
MLRLVYSREPRWIEIGGGAELCIEPATIYQVYAAQARAAALLSDLKDAGAAVSMVGGQVVNVPDLSEPEREQSTLEALFVISLGELLISDWRNVRSADGTDLDFDPALIVVLFEDETIAARFLREARGPLHEVDLEGNGFPASPSGISERGGDEATAMPAATKAPPAPRRARMSARIISSLRALLKGAWFGKRSGPTPGA